MIPVRLFQYRYERTTCRRSLQHTLWLSPATLAAASFLSDGLTGQSGVGNPLAVENVKYQLAQDIIDDEVSSMQDSMEPVEVTGSLFGGIRCAAGYEDYDWEYLKVWSQIVVL